MAINKAPIIYATLMILVAILGWSKQLLFAKLLGPVGIGIYSTFVLVYSYFGIISHLGIRDGMLREASILKGKGDEDEAENICNYSNGAALKISIVLLLLFEVVVWLSFRESIVLRDAILWGGLAGVVSSMFAFVTVELRVKNLTIQFAIIILLKAAITISFGFVLFYWIGIDGILLAETIAFALLFVVGRRLWLTKSRIVFKKFKKIKSILLVGAPQMLSGLLVFTSLNIERWFVLSSLGLESFGQYSFGMTIALGGVLVLNIVQAYLGPGYIRDYGEKRDAKRLMIKLVKTSLAMIALGLSGWLVLLILCPIIEKIFTQYEDGIKVALIVAPGVAAQMGSLYSWMFYAIKKTHLNLLLTSMTTIVALVLNSYGIIQTAKIEFFAWIYTVCRMFELAITFSTAMAYSGLFKRKRMI